jgi:hypothetical protein
MTGRNLESVVVALLMAASLGAAPAHAQDIGGTGSGSSLLTPNFALDAGVADLNHIDDATTVENERCSEYLDAVSMLPFGEQWPLLGRLGSTHVYLDTFNHDGIDADSKPGARAQYSLINDVGVRPECELSHPTAPAPGR